MKQEIKTITCSYGIGNKPTDCFIYGNEYKGFWYVVKGSVNVNKTGFNLSEVDFIDVETLQDFDIITASEPINSEEDLLRLIEDE